MIICDVCGARNEQGVSFCGNCGSYLEWEEESPAEDRQPSTTTDGAPDELPAPESTPEEGPEEPPQQEEPAQQEQPAPEPRRWHLPRHEAEHEPQEPSPAAAERIAEPTAEAPAPAQPAAPQPAPAKPAPAQPAPRTPAAVKPGEVHKPRRTPLPEEEEAPPEPGDLICGNCGAGNDAARKFCRRCGTSLADAPVAKKPPWYKRIFRRKAAAPVAAGSRPTVAKAHKDRSHLWRWLILVAALLGVGIYLSWGLIEQGVEWVGDNVGDPAPVTATNARSSTSAPGHPANLTIDGLVGTWWAPADGAASGESITYRFEEPTRLTALLIFPGTSRDQEEFLQQARPRSLRVVATSADGSSETADWELRDEPGQQTTNVSFEDVKAVRLVIRDAYGAAPGSLVAVSEVEFYTRGSF